MDSRSARDAQGQCISEKTPQWGVFRAWISSHLRLAIHHKVWDGLAICANAISSHHPRFPMAGSAAFEKPPDCPAAFLAVLHQIFWGPGESFTQYLSSCRAQSDFTADAELAADGHYVLLSTCAYDFNDARYVLHGMLEQVEAP